MCQQALYSLLINSSVPFPALLLLNMGVAIYAPSQVWPLVLIKPIEKGKLIVKIEKRDLFNVATSWRGTKRSKNILKSVSRVLKCDPNVKRELTICVSERPH